MTAPWTPEHEVDAAQAALLIAEQFPALAGQPVVPLATGWDNTVHLVGGQWVFRFPRREIALRLLVHETAVLPRLAGRLPLPIPRPEFLGTPSARFPWPFWGARLLPGVELADTGLPDDQRTHAAVDLGGFLRRLHDPALAVLIATVSPAGVAAAATTTPGDRSPEAGPAVVLPHDPMRRADPGVRGPMARERLAALSAAGLWQPDPAVFRLLDEAEPLGPPDGPPVLVHGDLHQRHLLLAGDGRAAGVIDWGDVCLADPAVDLSLAYGGFAGGARAALLAAYGPVPPERAARARVLAVHLSAVLAEYAHAENRAALLREALAGIGRAAR
ncbi:aminoglycoside phosphotransferase [Catellatospora methionotrophica]|uniref:Aminoglycoside phosphotransferase n=1 Tax=Catellatospora methionotrophica TaxID=121620 RepID=A0A8J3PH37_9ACTN|nr:phosphotransferase [Catellatospora methionotrophica]GIG16937.1 aminoglycoside phosphotransferase [Catellatospora methionotrophica]